MTEEEIKDFCDMKVQLEPENEDIYKTIVKALEQEPVLDKIKARIELEKLGYPPSAGYYKAIMKCLQIIDKYKTESEEI